MQVVAPARTSCRTVNQAIVCFCGAIGSLTHRKGVRSD
mgnify:CR=1 FL=1